MKDGIDYVSELEYAKQMGITASERYSQGQEQHFILKSVAGGPTAKLGRFLDIGAWNPTDKSNTRALWELGWSGVMIEPSPGPMRELIKAYGNDKGIRLVSAAVALESWGPVASMHVTDDALSTTEEGEFKKWSGTAHFDGMLIVPVITAQQIGQLFGEFDFISIDTEGTSVDIFEDFLCLGHRPQCICVEYNDRKAEAIAYASKSRFSLIHENENNLIFERSAE
jgi:FkbM family methyltransferase